MNEIASRYDRRASAVEATIAAVRPGQWDGQSPCAAWTARGVVGHMVDMHAYMLRPLGLSLPASPTVAEDPLAAFRTARSRVAAVLADPVLAATECATPGGPMTAGRHIDAVVSDDLVLHRWDLAAATGQDRTIDPEDAGRMWAAVAAIPAEVMAKYRTPGAFGPGVEVYGPEVMVPPDASVQDRLLGAAGRDPGWSQQ